MSVFTWLKVPEFNAVGSGSIRKAPLRAMLNTHTTAPPARALSVLPWILCCADARGSEGQRLSDLKVPQNLLQGRWLGPSAGSFGVCRPENMHC